MTFIFVGRLDELKGIKLLFEVWAMMGESAPKLIVCGSGPMEKWCKEFISKNKLHNIKMLGKLPHDKIGGFLRKAQALIMCSQWYETFGMVIIEAYSCKKPVLAGRIGNIKDLVIEGKTGYTFEYNSKVALMDVIEKMGKADDISMGTEAYRVFKDKYSAQANYEQLMRVYGEVLKIK